jgi:hypothetical protein
MQIGTAITVPAGGDPVMVLCSGMMALWKVLDADLIFSGEGICHLHVKILSMNPASHGSLCRITNFVNSVKLLAGCHESPNRLAVYELHETIEIVAKEDLLEFFDEAFDS